MPTCWIASTGRRSSSRWATVWRDWVAFDIRVSRRIEATSIRRLYPKRQTRGKRDREVRSRRCSPVPPGPELPLATVWLVPLGPELPVAERPDYLCVESLGICLGIAGGGRMGD